MQPPCIVLDLSTSFDVPFVSVAKIQEFENLLATARQNSGVFGKSKWIGSYTQTRPWDICILIGGIEEKLAASK